MAHIIDGALVASDDDADLASFQLTQLDDRIALVKAAADGWDDKSDAEKQAWLLNNFGTVLRTIQRILQFIRRLNL